MILAAVAAFIGAFSALVALAEIQASSKLIRYLAAFVVGVIFTVLLALLAAWVGRIWPT